MTMLSPRPTRFSHVLKRLLAGKTHAINTRVARVLAANGLITIDDAGSEASAVKVTLTEAGRAMAKLAVKGVQVQNSLVGVRKFKTRKPRPKPVVHTARPYANGYPSLGGEGSRGRDD